MKNPFVLWVVLLSVACAAELSEAPSEEAVSEEKFLGGGEGRACYNITVEAFSEVEPRLDKASWDDGFFGIGAGCKAPRWLDGSRCTCQVEGEASWLIKDQEAIDRCKQLCGGDVRYGKVLNLAGGSDAMDEDEKCEQSMSKTSSLGKPLRGVLGGVMTETVAASHCE